MKELEMGEDDSCWWFWQCKLSQSTGQNLSLQSGTKRSKPKWWYSNNINSSTSTSKKNRKSQNDNDITIHSSPLSAHRNTWITSTKAQNTRQRPSKYHERIGLWLDVAKWKKQQEVINKGTLKSPKKTTEHSNSNHRPQNSKTQCKTKHNKRQHKIINTVQKHLKVCQQIQKRLI